MNLERFQSGISQILFSPYGDSQFTTLRTVCGGMSGVKTAKLLNFGVECLDLDELYFEIGVYTGYTMVSAGFGHHRHIIGVDNSSEFGDATEKRTENMRNFPHGLYQFIPADFRNVSLPSESKKKVGVLYIDGKHDFKEVMDSFTWAENDILSDKAIVVLDDVSVNGVSDAIFEWLSNKKDFKPIFYLKPFFKENSFQHDISSGIGFAVLKYERSLN